MTRQEARLIKTWHPNRVAAREVQDVCWNIAMKFAEELTTEGKAILSRIIARAQQKENAWK